MWSSTDSMEMWKLGSRILPRMLSSFSSAPRKTENQSYANIYRIDIFSKLNIRRLDWYLWLVVIEEVMTCSSSPDVCWGFGVCLLWQRGGLALSGWQCDKRWADDDGTKPTEAYHTTADRDREMIGGPYKPSVWTTILFPSLCVCCTAEDRFSSTPWFLSFTFQKRGSCKRSEV